MIRSELNKKILTFIQEYHDENHWAPTVREIGAAIGVKSTSMVQGYLLDLQDLGKIVYKGVRKIRVVE
ncbi:MAG: LexA family transcriptional regulator [Bacillota bacterium]|nr:LexA family transcriptional regulator [Bacillota bacterium]